MSDSYHIMVKRDRTAGCKTFLILMRPIGHIFKMLKIDVEWSGVEWSGVEWSGVEWDLKPWAILGDSY